MKLLRKHVGIVAMLIVVFIAIAVAVFLFSPSVGLKMLTIGCLLLMSGWFLSVELTNDGKV